MNVTMRRYASPGNAGSVPRAVRTGQILGRDVQTAATRRLKLNEALNTLKRAK